MMFFFVAVGVQIVAASNSRSGPRKSRPPRQAKKAQLDREIRQLQYSAARPLSAAPSGAPPPAVSLAEARDIVRPTGVAAW